eukprot:m.2792 g.2792  ORF g.2792 m.2792 type:complete len:75 (-) comp2740_c0_seq1:469-693(-)
MAFASLRKNFMHDLKAEPEILPLISLVTMACGFACYMMGKTLVRPDISLQKNHKSNWENMMEASGKSSDRAASC